MRPLVKVGEIHLIPLLGNDTKIDFLISCPYLLVFNFVFRDRRKLTYFIRPENVGNKAYMDYP